ncbi:hypothetical protein J8I29_21285 [Labrys sp. LIt4]|uniref:Uncharacterized protein n=1 Tax=Labrys okinawensis TaxID=346911 RepID=A0A2S9Q7Z2_9HYPH|nr:MULTISPECIES: hypothetical protein [Labrys]MBP0581877.1 hypothetical protein [Labrys sp. LIt4]PRH85476.1 hypothetical protein C5L14_21035 [Labrys okinawensis]
MSERESWSVDKKIPLALVIALFVQTGGVVWWSSQLNSRVTVIEERNLKLEVEIGKLKDGSSEVRERFARAETTMQAFVETTRRIEAKLDRLIDDKLPSRTISPR